MNRHSLTLTSATTIVAAGAALWMGSALAAPLPQYPFNSGALFDGVMRGEAVTPTTEVDAGPEARLQRQMVTYATAAPAGTVVIDIAQTYLYFIIGDGRAIRYGIGVGRDGFTWSGAQSVTRKAEWPDWTPPQEMIARQPYLPRFMAGGEGNPLGARAIYLGSTVYRIHGTNMPETIGRKVSSGCIRMLNEDVIDLYARVDVGTRIVVLDHRAAMSAVPAALARTRLATPRAHALRVSAIY
jgi:lipoprotein-anchoring transpeptidase ErfK/SrfK